MFVDMSRLVSNPRTAWAFFVILFFLHQMCKSLFQAVLRFSLAEGVSGTVVHKSVGGRPTEAGEKSGCNKIRHRPTIL